MDGRRQAPTAEALMRSRFSAFARDRLDHIRRTWAPETRDPAVSARTAGDDTAVEWLALEILSTFGGGVTDMAGTVEFAARYRSGARIGIHREKSAFRREDGVWLYVGGEVAADDERTRVKAGRNDPCPCGSGRKFKKCCGA